MIGLSGKTLTTKHLTIRLLRDADQAPLMELLQDESVTRPGGFLPPVGAEKQAAFFRDFTRHNSAVGAFLGEDIIGYLHVGRCHTPLPEDAGNDCVCLGFVIGRPYQQQGYGTELLSCMTEYLLTRHDACFADYFEGNLPSMRTIEKCGYTPRFTYSLYFEEFDKTIPIHANIRKKTDRAQAQWYIKDYVPADACSKDTMEKGMPQVTVTLRAMDGTEKMETVVEGFLTMYGLTLGSPWPDFSGVRLETEHLILRKAVQADYLPMYQNLWMHAESARYMLWSVTQSEQEAYARMERTIDFQKYNQYALLITLKESGEAIGFCGMRQTEPGLWKETGIALGPSFTGRGYGTEVLCALLACARENGGTAFEYTNRRENTASSRLKEKCGFLPYAEEEMTDPRDGTQYILEISRREL